MSFVMGAGEARPSSQPSKLVAFQNITRGKFFYNCLKLFQYDPCFMCLFSIQHGHEERKSRSLLMNLLDCVQRITNQLYSNDWQSVSLGIHIALKPYESDPVRLS